MSRDLGAGSALMRATPVRDKSHPLSTCMHPRPAPPRLILPAHSPPSSQIISFLTQELLLFFTFYKRPGLKIFLFRTVEKDLRDLSPASVTRNPKDFGSFLFRAFHFPRFKDLSITSFCQTLSGVFLFCAKKRGREILSSSGLKNLQIALCLGFYVLMSKIE